MKTPVLESRYEIFKSTFFYRTPPVAASEECFRRILIYSSLHEKYVQINFVIKSAIRG